MNLISKVKKIAVCGVASLGLLVSTGNLGLSAMNPYQFSGFGMTNRGSDFVGFSSQDAERVRASRSAASSQSTDLGMFDSRDTFRFGAQNVAPFFQRTGTSIQAPAAHSLFSGFNMTNRGSDFVGFSSQDAERVRASRSAASSQSTDLGMFDPRDTFRFGSQNVDPFLQRTGVSMPTAPSQPSGFGMTNRGSDFVGFSSQDAERVRASRPEAPQNATTYAATERVALPAITVGGRNVRDLDEREKIELTRRGLALYAKNNITWNEVAMLLEVSPSTLQNWVRLYEEGAVARYTAQEKRAHILKYLKEHKMFNSTSADYAERHGLLVSTFKKWVNDYKI